MDTELTTYQPNTGIPFDAPKLLPCPFCGSEATLIFTGNDHTKSRKATAKCLNCRAQITNAAMRHGSEWVGRNTIEDWNTRKTPKRTDKEIFDLLIELTEKYTLVKGEIEFVKNENGGGISIGYVEPYHVIGIISEDVFRDAFHENDWAEYNGIKEEGRYKYKALLLYNSAQVGNYPPPNIEVPEHYEILHIELEYLPELDLPL